MKKPARYRVLLYHGVHGDDLELGRLNSSGKHISRERFREEMRVLKERAPLVTIRDIAAAHAGTAELEDGSVAVTFDDGYWNNYSEAWPVLEEFQVPATIYLATGFIGTGRIIWTDRLEAALVTGSAKQVSIDVDGDRTIFNLYNGEERIHALGQIKKHCKSMSADKVEETVASVESQLGATADSRHPLYRFMTWDEVREMAVSPLIDFGAHTVDHVSLARVPVGEMVRQIDESVASLFVELGGCDLFSYPEGQPGDFNHDVIAYLRSKGFSHAPTAIAGENIVGETDAFHIHRDMVGFEGRPFPFAPVQSSSVRA